MSEHCFDGTMFDFGEPIRRTLDIVKYETSKEIDDWDLQNSPMERTIQDVAERCTRRMTISRVMYALKGERASAEETYEVPANAWSAFRIALGWKWLLKLLPPKLELRTVTVEQDVYERVCPHLNIAPQGRHMQFMTVPTGGIDVEYLRAGYDRALFMLKKLRDVGNLTAEDAFALDDIIQNLEHYNR